MYSIRPTMRKCDIFKMPSPLLPSHRVWLISCFLVSILELRFLIFIQSIGFFLIFRITVIILKEMSFPSSRELFLCTVFTVHHDLNNNACIFSCSHRVWVNRSHRVILAVCISRAWRWPIKIQMHVFAPLDDHVGHWPITWSMTRRE